MKIGVYTLHLVHNYGAQLQAYATSRFLNFITPKHCNIELVNIKAHREKHTFRWFIKNITLSYLIRRYRFWQFHKRLSLSPTKKLELIFKNPLDYDLHITGSDQIWNVSFGMPKFPVYFLPFITNKPKIALASSFGVSTLPDSVKPHIKNFLSSFDSISTREIDGVKILNELGIQGKLLLDPTFWLDEQEWLNLAGETPIIHGEYIAAYNFEPNNANSQALFLYAREYYKLPIVNIDGSRRLKKYAHQYNSAGPKEFLNIIKFAKVVITGSFHGTSFSIIFRKNFYVLAHSLRNSRMESLLKQLELADRMLYDEKDFNKIGLPIDYDATYSILTHLQADSRNYITQTVNKYIRP